MDLTDTQKAAVSQALYHRTYHLEGAHTLTIAPSAVTRGHFECLLEDRRGIAIGRWVVASYIEADFKRCEIEALVSRYVRQKRESVS